MSKLVVSEWMTLDGVYDAETMDSWWLPYDSHARQRAITEGISACEAMLYGRRTYEMLAPFWSAQTTDDQGPAAKLNSVPKYVVSSSLQHAEWQPATILRGNLSDAIIALKQQIGGDILITGSATLVHSLMETDLIDEYRVLVQPIVMGRGKQFWRANMPMTRLNLVRTTYPKGVLSLTYQPIKR